MTIASIDAVTGRTVLIGLPRNMANFPFAEGSVMDEQFPDGFDCEGCYLNGVSTWAEDNTELFPDSSHPGMDATVEAIEGITGLHINYWAMVNLQGFKDLVDAVGGVTLNVRSPIPVGGLGSDVTGYIQPGVRKLNGHDTLWYARAREGSDDYSRMARQKCVMNAMLQQISPQGAVRNFAEIAEAGSSMISTDVPASELDLFVQLALKAKGQKVSTLSLVPPLVNTADPHIPAIKAKVAQAIDRAEGQAPASAPKKATGAPSTDTVCSPACVHTRSTRVDATPPIASVTSTVTLAAAVVRYVTVAASAWPSPFGLIASGCAAALSIERAAAFAPARRMPLAGRAAPAAIVQRYEPGGTPAESHIQSTVVPVPEPPVTSAPAAVVTTTVHGCDWEMRARKRIAVPDAVAFGSKIFVPPNARAEAAMAPSRA